MARDRHREPTAETNSAPVTEATIQAFSPPRHQPVDAFAMFDGLNITTRVRGASQGITCQQPEHTDAAVMSETAKRATEPPFHDTRDVLQSRAIDGFRREGANPRIAFCGAEGLAYLELHSSACHLNASSA